MQRIVDIYNEKEIAELKIINCQVFDVFNMRFIETPVVIDAGKIISFENIKAQTVIDGKGQYLIPGLVDTHMHIESTLMRPLEYSKVALQNGVMHAFSDPHEIANIAGVDGLNFLLDEVNKSLIDIHIMLPSTVPCMSGESCKQVLDAKILNEYYQHPQVKGLSEIMDIKRLEQADIDYLQKLIDAKNQNKQIDGHMIGFSSKQIDLARSLHIETDHETVAASELNDKLMRGVKVLLREGTVAKDFSNLYQHITLANNQNIALCTDDIEIDDMISNGSINRMVKIAINGGMDPLLALKLATYNGANLQGLKDVGAIAPGYVADLLIVSDLKQFTIDTIIKSGKVITNEMLKPKSQDKLTNESIDCQLSVEELRLTPQTKMAIKINEDSLLTDYVPAGHNDNIVAVINRYGKKQYSCSYVQGFNLKQGVIASTVSHDSHNLIMLGTDSKLMRTAYSKIRQTQGGLYYFTGEQMYHLELDCFGLLSSLGYKQLQSAHHQLINKVSDNIDFKNDPFLALAFLALPVIPKVKITDRGLYHFESGKYYE